ncbi:hypothetical protein PybrP1_006549 [[Pythium] brassicae (nom. inval.)]|nr:hypothetical protein PybrP1_006549 [[Pythium] brassicae (nom. inval.)]
MSPHTEHQSSAGDDAYAGFVARELVRLPSIASSSGCINRDSNSRGAVPKVDGDTNGVDADVNAISHRPETDSPMPVDAHADTPGKRKKKRKARICKEPSCDKYVVDHGLCIRHGFAIYLTLCVHSWLAARGCGRVMVVVRQGGKRCNVEGCNCRAQNRGLCWKHGERADDGPCAVTGAQEAAADCRLQTMLRASGGSGAACQLRGLQL